MRILYHHRTASKDGQAVHIEEMVGALRNLGHEVCVVGPAQGTAEMGASLSWVDRLKSALPNAFYELLELGYSFVALVRVARTVSRFHPDVIYERYNLFLLAGLMAKRCFKLPLVLEVNSPLVHERSRGDGIALGRLAKWTERSVWLGADRVLPVTNALAGFVMASGVPAERVVVVSNGVNDVHFAKALSTEDAKVQLGLAGRLVLGFTGFVRDWHGVDRIVRWMADPAVPCTTHLLVVGDGPARSRLEELAREYGLERRVTFTGVVSRERIPDCIAAFDVALQPAVVPYASPLKLFEYLALGKAIVAPRKPNVEELLTDGKNALLFEPDDPAALANALHRIVESAELRDRLAAGAAKTIQEMQLTWLDCGRRVSGVCEGLVHGAGGSKAGYQCRSAS
jgi:glycosyltransferase involved in cell wall biosynthesis